MTPGEEGSSPPLPDYRRVEGADEVAADVASDPSVAVAVAVASDSDASSEESASDAVAPALGDGSDGSGEGETIAATPRVPNGGSAVSDVVVDRVVEDGGGGGGGGEEKEATGVKYGCY